MVNKIIDKAETLIENTLEVEVTLPRVTKKMLKKSVKVNGLVAGALLVSGVVVKSKFLVVAGTLSIASAIATNLLIEED